MEEWNKVHGAEYRTLNKELMDLAQQLAKQGKYLDLSKRGQNSQADAILQKIDAIRPPLASFDKRQEVFKEREDLLTGHRRQVSFRIYTNRTPSTTAFAYPAKPMGTLAGHPFYRQDGGTIRMGGDRVESIVNLAVFLGPSGFQNPHANLVDRQLSVKCIVVWAWIESRPDTIQADEATARKVLEKIDYDGLSKMIEPYQQ